MPKIFHCINILVIFQVKQKRFKNARRRRTLGCSQVLSFNLLGKPQISSFQWAGHQGLTPPLNPPPLELSGHRNFFQFLVFRASKNLFFRSGLLLVKDSNICQIFGWGQYPLCTQIGANKIFLVLSLSHHSYHFHFRI